MSEKGRSHHALAGLAERQYGVVAIRQLAALGYSKDEVGYATDRGRFHLIHHGVYAVGHEAVSPLGRCLAAVLSCGDGALLSHRSAAWMWGLTARFARPVEVTATSPRRHRSEILVHSARALAPEDRDSTESIPITAVARTLLDFAAIDPRFLDRALNNAHRLGLLDPIAVDALISRSRGFRGVARLRQALEIHRPSDFTRSGLERHFLDLVRRAGLARPSMNFTVAEFELDAYWPAERFAVELDTYDHHGDPGAFERDRLRQEELKLIGIEMIRITGVRLDREPRVVIQRLRRLLALRRRELAHFNRRGN